MGKLKHGHTRKRHRTPTYTTWLAMKRRCENPRARGYRWYGAKGIGVCEEWQRFENFLASMGSRPLGYTVHRIDSGKGYEPGNCEWRLLREHCGVKGERVKRVSPEQRRKNRRLKEALAKRRDLVRWRARKAASERRRRERRRGGPVATEISDRMRRIALARWDPGVEVELVL
jgi:hypothetical protein